MKIRFVSMRKYHMLLGWKYRLKNLVSIDKRFSGKLIQVRFFCEYGFDIDMRKGTFFDWMLNDKEKKSFLMRLKLLSQRN